jgi:hypothetical protein
MLAPRRRAPVVPLAVVLAVLVAAAPVVAVLPTLDRDAVERALQVARGTDRVREAFHARYIVRPDDALVEQVEIITEFRRVVLIAEDHLRAGDWMFSRSAPRAEAALEPWRGVVAIVARLRFNPLNVYVSVPSYDIEIGPANLPLKASSTERRPITATSNADGSTSLLGTIVESRFERAAVGEGSREVRVVLDGDTEGTVTVDFSGLD